ncbi:MAG: hypothetical protein HY268_07835 [Deltaproteobacteria bacterium]|nr:hypothetical protein [Deltaproteobacteria bacterium]
MRGTAKPGGINGNDVPSGTGRWPVRAGMQYIDGVRRVASTPQTVAA